jgi:hypothetical protein
MKNKKFKKLSLVEYFDEIFNLHSLDNIIFKIWKHKFLLILFTLIGFSLGHIYDKKTVIDNYQTVIVLKHPSVQLFNPYGDGDNLRTLFLSKISLYLHSNDNFEDFLILNYKDLNSSSLQFSKHKEIINAYNLVYPKNVNVNGNQILTDYITFTNKKALAEFKLDLIKDIKNKIKKYENAYEISTIISLENPIVTMRDSVVIDNDALFYQGRKVLGLQILHFNQILRKIEKDFFEYDFILDKSNSTLLKNKNNNDNKILGMLFGLLVSILLINFLNILNILNNKKSK